MRWIKKRLDSDKFFFSLWCIIASFGAYFCMYAFRKPFNTGLYADYALWGIDYKIVLIITQVLGYMTSKFIGIKVISELSPYKRIKLILGLILFSEIALFLFGLTPFPYNWVFLFFNGLPLGMVWGVIFSFLEGRRTTEVLALGLSGNMVVSSGVLKTIYLNINESFGLSEFWMPFVIGLIFLPIFVFFVWMLSVIPKPNAEDIAQRSIRPPMARRNRQQVIKQFGWGLLCVTVAYALMATIRDFRDNFSVEIWKQLDSGFDKAVFARTETTIGVIVLMMIATIAIIKNNIKAFNVLHLLMFLSLLLCGVSSWLFEQNLISAYWWMIMLGVGLFFPYLSIQTVFFERLIAIFRINANAGFMVYICDSVGYLGSVGLLIYKNFFLNKLSWVDLLIFFGYAICIVGCVLLILELIFFGFTPKPKEQILNELTSTTS